MMTGKRQGLGRVLLAVAMLICAGRAAGAEDTTEAEDGVLYDTLLWGGGTRIPSIDITPRGTLLAFAQRGGGDNHPNHIQVRRSTDSGKTWGKVRSFENKGFEKRVSCANPCPLVDHETGEVRVFWAVRTLQNGLQMEGLYYSHSKDDGVTWSDPARFQVGDDPTIGYSTTSRGIQLSTGRLLAPYTKSTRDPKRRFPAQVIYSDDHGKTWAFGKQVPQQRHAGNSTEFNLLELADGRVYMNHRTSYGEYRWISFSEDGGIRWSKSEWEKQHGQYGKNGCQAGLVRLTHPKQDDKGRVLFSYPWPMIRQGNRWVGDPKAKGKMGRYNLMIRISYDECKTWKPTKLVRTGNIAYSNLVVFPDKSIGCIYEYSDLGRKIWQSVRFCRFTLDWLTDGKDRIPRGE